MGRYSVDNDIVRTYVGRLIDNLKDKPPQIILNKRGMGIDLSV